MGRKSVFPQKKTPQIRYRLTFIWVRGTFSRAQLCLAVARTWFPSKSECFFSQKIRISAQKSVFCCRTPGFVNGPFVALGQMLYFAPSDQCYDFSFWVTAVFVTANAPKSLPLLEMWNRLFFSSKWFRRFSPFPDHPWPPFDLFSLLTT